MRLLTDGQKLALKGILILGLLAAHNNGLTDNRHVSQHGGAEHRGVDRHIAPAEQGLAFDADEVLELTRRHFTGFSIARQKTHGHSIVTDGGQGEILPLGPVAQQGIGNLNQAASAITDHRVSAHGAAMVDIDQNLQALFDDIVGL